MYVLLLVLHSVLRWFVLLALVGRTGLALQGLSGRAPGPLDRRASLITTIVVDVQLLLGLGLFFVSPIVAAARADVGAAMKDAVLRFFLVEHTTIMVLAVVAVHVASVVARRRTGRAAHVAAAVGFGIALLLVLAGIPWPFREGIGRPWVTLGI